MASFQYSESALPELIRQLEDNGLYDEENTKKILYAGAEIFVKEARSALVRAGHIDTGAMRDSITYYRKVDTKDGVHSVSMSIKGKDAKGAKNAVKAFVLNYGRKKAYGYIPGSHFWNAAILTATPKMIRACEDAANTILHEKGLI